MRFPRSVRPTKGSLEAAPWATVMFLLVMFIMLGAWIYTPGAHVELPVTDELPATDKLPVRIAMDGAGRLFFENQLVTSETMLTNRLREIVRSAPEKPALVVEADKNATYDNLVRLMQLARSAGFETTVLATLPRPSSKRAAP